MNIDQLRAQFPNDQVCRQFFESIRWPAGRICPHCGHSESYIINVRNAPYHRYQCKKCSRQFTVTTKTALHSTNLPLWKWLQAMYLIACSSKGISSVVLARLIGVTQPTAWKMGHVIRKMMDPKHSDVSFLSGIIELDETYVGGKPIVAPGKRNKRGKGTAKH